MELYQNLRYVDNLVEGKPQKSHLLIPNRLRCICVAQCLILYRLVSISGRAGRAAVWVWGQESVEFSSRPPSVTRRTLRKTVKQGERGWQRESDTHFLPLTPYFFRSPSKTVGQHLPPLS